VPSTAPERTNYSQKLAEFVSAKINKPIDSSILKKIRHTKELKTLPRDERHKEIEDSFTASFAEGKKICVIDDVTASGATLGEIAKVLKDSGASYVCAAVIAVYMPHS
jgi:predicted amidophosphoribosyltransferase